MELDEMKVHRLEHPVDGWGAKKVDEFLLKSDVDEWADEQMLAYNDLEKRLGKTIAEKGRKNAELFAENADLRNHIKELEREKAALLKTQEFHLDSIKELEDKIRSNVND